MIQKTRVLIVCLVVLFFSVCGTAVPVTAKATNQQMNIITYFDWSATAQYGVPGMFMTRFPVIANRVKSSFDTRFSINLNFTNLYAANVIQTDMGDCILTNNYTYNVSCQHFNFLLGTLPISSVCSFHHTNYTRLKNEFFNDNSVNTSNNVALYVSAGPYCYVDNSGTHYKAQGYAFPSNSFIELQDFDYDNPVYDYYIEIERGNDITDIDHTDYATSTLYHEIGHMYGASHHYSSGNTECLYGANHYDPEVMYFLKNCGSCWYTIYPNRGTYNHT